jgi:hypothetical protein
LSFVIASSIALKKKIKLLFVDEEIYNENAHSMPFGSRMATVEKLV